MPAKLNLSLHLDILDERREDMKLTRFSKTKTCRNEVTRDHFTCDFKDSPITRLEALEQADPEVFAAETKLFEDIVSPYLNDPESLVTADMAAVLGEYVTRSHLFNDGDKAELQDFVEKFGRTQAVLAGLYVDMGDEWGEKDLVKARKRGQRKLTSIWGRQNITFKDTSAEGIAESYGEWFDSILHDLDAAEPPVHTNARVQYEVTVNEAQGLMRQSSILSRFMGLSKEQTVLKGTIPFSQLPSRFQEIRDVLGIGADDVPNYRLYLDAETPDLKQSFRIAAAANTVDALFAPIAEEFAARQAGDDLPENLRYRFTLQSLNLRNVDAFTLMTPNADDLDELTYGLKGAMRALARGGQLKLG